MTSLQIYILVAPLILAAIGWAAAYWWISRDDHEQRRAK